MNLLGLGFNFGAKDSGLKSKQRDVAAGFRNVSDHVERMGRESDQSHHGLGLLDRGFRAITDTVEKLGSMLRMNRLQTFIQAISLSRLNDIAEKLGDVSSAGGTLTTSFEATITASQKSARALGANFGYSGRALGKFTSQATSMGIALNMSAEEAAKGIYGFQLAVKEMRAVGVKSSSDMAKLASVTGVETQEFADALRTMRRQFQFTDEDLRVFTGSTVHAGQVIGDVGGMLKSMPKILDLVGRRAAAMGKKLSSKDLAQFGAQTAQLTSVFYEMGISADQAQELATGIATKMVEAGENFGDMFAGTKQDLDQFHMALGISTGDINTAFETMKQGPAEFMTGMAKMVLKSKKGGKDVGMAMNMLRGRLSEVFGAEQAAQITNFYSRADEATLQMMSRTRQVQTDLGKLANEGYRTGRTLQESFDLAKDGFILNFRAIGKSAAVDFVQETKSQFKDFNKQLNEIVKDGGPLAGLVIKFSELHQIGALALIPETLRPIAALGGTMVKELTPALGVLGSLGFRFSMLTSPVALVIAGISALGVWFASLRMEGKSTGEALKVMGEKIKSVASKVWNFAKKQVAELVDYLRTVDWEKILMKVGVAVLKLGISVAEFVNRIPWKKIFDTVIGKVGEALEFTASERFREIMLEIAGKAGQVAGKVVDVAFDALESAFDYLNKADLGKLLDNIGRTMVNLAEAIVAATTMALEKFVARLPALLRKAVDLVVKLLLEVPAAVGKFLSNAGAMIGKYLPRVVEAVLDGVWAVLQAIPRLLWKMIQSLPEILMSMGSLVVSAMEFVKNAILGVFTGIENWLVKKFPEAAGVIHGVFTVLKTAIVVPFKILKFAVQATIKVITYLVELVGDVLVGAWNLFSGAIEFVWDSILEPIWSGFKIAVEAIGDAFEWVWEKISPIIDAISSGISVVTDALSSAWDAVSSVGDSVGDFLGGVADGISGFFSDGETKLVDSIMAKAKTQVDELSTSTKSATEQMNELWNSMLDQAVIDANAKSIGQKAAEDIMGNWIDLVATGQRTQDEMMRIAGGLSRQFAESNRQMVNTMSEDLRGSVDEAAKALNEAYLAELNFVMQATDLSAEDRKGRLASIQAEFAVLQQSLTMMANQTDNQLTVQGQSFEGEAKNRFDVFTKGIEDRKSKVTGAAAEAVGTFKRELQVTNEEALSHIESIADINPKKFAKNLQIIKKSYITFAKDLIVETKEFAGDSAKLFNELTNKTMFEGFKTSWLAILDITNTSMAAITADVARALVSVQQIHMALRSATALSSQAAGVAVQQEVKLDVNKSIQENLYQATHHPDWYEKDFKFQVMAMVASLNAIVALLAKNGTPSGKQAAASSADAMAKVKKTKIGVGANRGKGGPGMN